MKLFITYHRAEYEGETSSKFAIIPANSLRRAIEMQKKHFEEAYEGMNVKVSVEDGTLLDLKLVMDFIKVHVTNQGIRYIIRDLEDSIKEGE